MNEKFRKTENLTGLSDLILIPVDFSHKCEKAITEGFYLAARLNARVEILHASLIPDTAIFPKFQDEYFGEDTQMSEIEEMNLINDINIIASKKMNECIHWIHEKIDQKLLPDIKFNTVLSPGMAEEVIKEYCMLNHPKMIVMATRSLVQRQEELIGSVTAEVIDNCRVPVLTIPENYQFENIKSITRLCAFCFLEGYDVECVDTLMELFEAPAVEIWLFPVSNKLNEEGTKTALENIKVSLSEKYPDSRFIVIDTESKNIKDRAAEVFRENKIQMVIAPNKKRNIFQRLFHPGLPHIILFEKDIPMFAIPV